MASSSRVRQLFHYQIASNEERSNIKSQVYGKKEREFYDKYPHIKKSLKMSLVGHNKLFGQDAPHFTIPSSRPNRPINKDQDMPGPGSYNINTFSTFGNKKHPRSSSCNNSTITTSRNSFINNEHITSTIEYKNTRCFPRLKPMTIGVKTNHEFYDIIESPGPRYFEQPRDTKLPHMIMTGGRDYSDGKPTRRKSTSVLGPGSYNINDSYFRKREPGFDLNKSSADRHTWMKSADNKLGPGHYNPTEVSKNEPQWTFGKKSRPHKIHSISGSDNFVPKKKDVIAVDHAMIHLEDLPDPDKARNYIMTHPDIRNVVNEIFSVVLNSKPDKPIEFLNEYFAQIKEFVNN